MGLSPLELEWFLIVFALLIFVTESFRTRLGTDIINESKLFVLKKKRFGSSC